MGINLSNPFGVGGVKNNIFIQPKQTSFGSLVTYPQDTFQNNSLTKYTTEEYLKYAIASNPKIREILKEIKANGELNIKELKDLSNGHCKDTQEIVTGMLEYLPLGLKQHVNVKSLKDAAFLHDIGKVLIPKEILNKPGGLDKKEVEIMHRHSELSYEILKNSDIDTRTLHLIKYHHQNASHTGYPKVKSDFFADINLQILNIADKYSALTEKRTYKESYDKDSALAIIYRDVIAGNIHPFVYKALHNSVTEQKNEQTKTFLNLTKNS